MCELVIDVFQLCCFLSQPQRLSWAEERHIPKSCSRRRNWAHSSVVHETGWPLFARFVLILGANKYVIAFYSLYALYLLSSVSVALLTEFRESRAGKDFFETCRSPEACCELTLQVSTTEHILSYLLLYIVYWVLKLSQFSVLATQTIPIWCCHHLLWHLGCASGKWRS